LQVRAIERALMVLDALQESDQGLSELSRKLELPKATLLRILNTLKMNDYIEKDVITQQYRLGLKLLHLGMIVSERFDLKKIATSYLQEIWNECGETVYLNILHEDEILCIDCLHGKKDVRVVAYTGRQSPLYVGASGKAVLAFLPPEKIEQYLSKASLKKVAPGTIIDGEKLKKDLEITRARGYATSFEERFSDALGTSAPLFEGVDGKVIGSVSITAPSNRSEEEVNMYIKLVTEAAQEISKKLRYKR